MSLTFEQKSSIKRETGKTFLVPKINQNKINSPIDKILDSNGFEQEIGDDLKIKKSNFIKINVIKVT